MLPRHPQRHRPKGLRKGRGCRRVAIDSADVSPACGRRRFKRIPASPTSTPSSAYRSSTSVRQSGRTLRRALAPSDQLGPDAADNCFDARACMTVPATGDSVHGDRDTTMKRHHGNSVSCNEIERVRAVNRHRRCVAKALPSRFRRSCSGCCRRRRSRSLALSPQSLVPRRTAMQFQEP